MLISIGFRSLFGGAGPIPFDSTNLPPVKVHSCPMIPGSLLGANTHDTILQQLLPGLKGDVTYLTNNNLS